jgi:4'-phosphopantetheinyl transferase
LQEDRIYWLTQSLGNLPSETDWLHPSELELFSRFRFQKKKNDWLLGRWAAKLAIRIFLKRDYPELEPDKIAILPIAGGAPEIYFGDKIFPLAVSISHSNEIAFCAVGSWKSVFGCDLEKIEPRSDAFIRDFFTENECSKYFNSNEAMRPLWANLIWSAKESALKAMKLGLSIDTRKLEITFLPKHDAAGWKSFSVKFIDTQKLYKGFWKATSGFAFTIVCDGIDLSPVEIEL